MAHITPRCRWGCRHPACVALQKPPSPPAQGPCIRAVELWWLELLPNGWHLSEVVCPQAEVLFCSLLSAILSHSPRHVWRMWRKDVFKIRDELSLLMLFWSSFKLMGDFFTLYPQKSYIWTLKMLHATVLRKCHPVPCTPNTPQNVRNQLMMDEGTPAVCRTQVMKGARSAPGQPRCLGQPMQAMCCPPCPAQF